MGQYFIIVNVDKKERLNPHSFGDGLKFLEFGSSGSGTMLGLAVLLRASCESGGGDMQEYADDLVGSWLGDRIAIIGDYDSEKRFGVENLYRVAHEEYKDISPDVIRLIASDDYEKRSMLVRNYYLLSVGEDYDRLREALGFSGIVEAACARKEALEAEQKACSDDREKQYYQRMIDACDAIIDNPREYVESRERFQY